MELTFDSDAYRWLRWRGWLMIVRKSDEQIVFVGLPPKFPPALRGKPAIERVKAVKPSICGDRAWDRTYDCDTLTIDAFGYCQLLAASIDRYGARGLQRLEAMLSDPFGIRHARRAAAAILAGAPDELEYAATRDLHFDAARADWQTVLSDIADTRRNLPH